MFPSTQLSLVLSLNLAAGAWARAVPAQQHQLAAGGGEVADRCAALVPCVECALGFSSCGQCPPAQVVSGLDAFSYQHEDVLPCLVLDQSSCILYFAHSAPQHRMWIQRERICPVVRRYDDSPLHDLMEHSPLFNVDLVPSTMAVMAATVGAV